MKSRIAVTNRIQKNHRKLKSWLKSNKIEAYRLYDKDIPEFPFIIDLYQNNAVVYEKGKLLEDTPENLQLREQNFSAIKEILREVMNIQPENVFFKIRKKQKGLSQYEVLSNNSTDNSKVITVSENGLIFEINLTDYLDTGLFLDHRPLRTEISKHNNSGTFLNLFAYTGSFSVCAAASGYEVTTVDMSNTYLNWSERNFCLNNFDNTKHHFIKADVLAYLKDCSEKFDCIFIDPPSFSNSKKMEQVFDVINDQDFLINHCMRILKPGGTLYFSNNARKFSLNQTLLDSYNVKDISEWSIPIDYRDKKIHKCYKITP